MTPNKKEQICKLLKGIETGDSLSVSVVNEEKYIQHNPQTHEGSEGLAELFKRLSKTSPRVNIVRVFEDGEYVFAHTEYDFASRNIGFEIFRFEDGQAVEHWDNIQKRAGPNSSGHSMVDGVTRASGVELTENNRETINMFIDEVLIKCGLDKLNDYIDQAQYVEHNPNLGDDISGLKKALFCRDHNNDKPASIDYRKCHRLLADGDFVLTVCEAMPNKSILHSSIFFAWSMEE
jgi:predicted SnoaL-like aldol condensation-catalyzing enzyme